MVRKVMAEPPCFDEEGWKAAVMESRGYFQVAWIRSSLALRWAHKAHFSSMMGFQVFLGPYIVIRAPKTQYWP